jgi:hypothetical protein
MGAPEIIAGVAALAAAGTGLGTYVLGSKRLTHERGLADRADARTVLAAAAVELWKAKQTMRDQYTRIESALRTGTAPEQFRDDIARLETRRDDLERSLDVLRIRFGAEHAVVTTYAAAWEASKGLISLYMTGVGGQGNAEGSRELLEQAETFDGHRADYLTAAQKTVGTRL